MQTCLVMLSILLLIFEGYSQQKDKQNVPTSTAAHEATTARFKASPQPAPHVRFQQHEINSAEYDVNDQDDDQALYIDEHAIRTELDPRHTENLKTVFKDTDKNKDNFIDFSEMYERLKSVGEEQTRHSAMQQWAIHNPDNQTFVSWDMIMNSTYASTSFTQNETDENSDFDDAHRELRLNTQKYMERDKIRFNAADANNDQKLDINEYIIFTNPGSNNHTKHILLDEIFNDMDVDKDGFVSFDEFIAELFNHNNNSDPNADWIKQEKDFFLNHRDTDKDGKLNKAEVENMFFPSNYDPLEAEAHHLISDADDDKDGKLSLDELLKHSELFFSSSVAGLDTNHAHDEL